MNRRRFISACGGFVVLIAGCNSNSESSNQPTSGDVATRPVVTVEMTAVTDAEIASLVTYPLDKLRDPKFAASVIENGSKVVESTTQMPAPVDKPFVHGGAVYELSAEVRESVPATQFRFTLTDPDEDSADDDSIQYGDLPEVDRAALENIGFDEGPPAPGGVATPYPNTAFKDSVLVPEPEYPVLVWGPDTRARIEVGQGQEMTLKTYEYTAVEVHESAAGFGQTIRKNHEIDLRDLSDAEADIVSEAITNEEGYEVTEGDPPDAFDSLSDRFAPDQKVTKVYFEDEPRTSITSGTYIVDYEDQVYWTEVHIRGELSGTDSEV